MEDDCLFCKIACGEIESEKVYEDNSIIAFLDIFPAVPGHTLIIPKNHYDTLNNTPDHVLANLISVAKAAARAVTSAFNADGVNLFQNNGLAAGQIIHHVHLHIVPRFFEDGLAAFKIKQKPYEGDQIKQVRQKITDHWERK
jgi:histidine triad (HIT) family protein